MHDEVRAMMENPKKIDDIANLDDYAGIFIPGGHGCMINLPKSVALGKVRIIVTPPAVNTARVQNQPTEKRVAAYVKKRLE